MPRVLIVDDDPLMVRTLCDVLRRSGYEARGAGSGEEAVATAGTATWAAVVMDVRMTGMSGVAACKRMREVDPELPVILMTAHSEPDVLDEARSAGVTRIFGKPFAIPELIAELRRSAREN